jgi:5-methylcytosine-specific restriction endonuclease McrA
MSKTKTYRKSIMKAVGALEKARQVVDARQETLDLLLEQEGELWDKTGECQICGTEGYTEWHHIISQHRCKEENLRHYIRLRGNVIELCKKCHDLTTASMIRKKLDAKEVSEDNASLEPTEKQVKYIKKLGGEIPNGLTRREASQLIDELKKVNATERVKQTTEVRY